MMDENKLDMVHRAHDFLIARMQTALLAKASPDFIRGLASRVLETDPRLEALSKGVKQNKMLVIDYCLACAEHRIKRGEPVFYPPDI